jgi:anti-sigma factor NepR-like protein
VIRRFVEGQPGRGRVMDDNNKPTGPKGPMAGSMQGSTLPKRKSSLNRETQIKIGTQLQITYNEVVNQGVPDRFVDLIRRLESGATPEAQNDENFEGVKDAPSSKGS